MSERQMMSWLRQVCFRVFMVWSIFVFSHAALADPANCDDDMNEDQRWLAKLCSAHAGCALVFGLQNSCVKAKSFLSRLGSGDRKSKLTDEEVGQALEASGMPRSARSSCIVELDRVKCREALAGSQITLNENQPVVALSRRGRSTGTEAFKQAVSQAEQDERGRPEREARERAEKAQAAERERQEQLRLEAEEKARQEERKRENREAWALVGGALTAAAGGKTSAERRQLAVGALSGSAGVGGLHDAGSTEFIPLSPPGSARSRNECVVFEWLGAPPEGLRGVPKDAYDSDLRDPENYGTRSSDSGRVEQRVLAVKNNCREDLIFIISACGEQYTLNPGSDYHEIPLTEKDAGKKTREKYKYSWSPGTHVVTEINGMVNHYFGKDADWGYRAVTAEFKTFPALKWGRQRKVRKVFFGAWLRSELTGKPISADDPARGALSWRHGYTDGDLPTASSWVLDRRRIAVSKLAAEVMNIPIRKDDEQPIGFGWGARDGARFGGIRGSLKPDPSEPYKLGKLCSNYTAEQLWDSTK